MANLIIFQTENEDLKIEAKTHKQKSGNFLCEFEQIKKENSVLNQNVQDAKQEIESLKRQVEEEKLR